MYIRLTYRTFKTVLIKKNVISINSCKNNVLFSILCDIYMLNGI